MKERGKLSKKERRMERKKERKKEKETRQICSSLLQPLQSRHLVDASLFKGLMNSEASTE
jgi:hypothetical protein